MKSILLFTLGALNLSAFAAMPDDGLVLPFPPTPLSDSVSKPRLQDSKMKWPAQPQRFHTTAICSPTRSAPLLFNIRMDPMESYDNKDSYGHMLQKNSWVFAPMGELMGKHLMTLGEYPPVQGGKSFDMSNVVQEFINKAKQ